MIFPENRVPPRIKSGAGFFGIMLYPFDPLVGCRGGGANWPGCGAGAKVGCALAGVIGCGPAAGCAFDFGLDFAAAWVSDGFFFAVLAPAAALCGS